MERGQRTGEEGARWGKQERRKEKTEPRIRAGQQEGRREKEWVRPRRARVRLRGHGRKEEGHREEVGMETRSSRGVQRKPTSPLTDSPPGDSGQMTMSL